MNQLLLDMLSKTTREEKRLLAGEKLDKTIYTDGGGFIVDPSRLLGQNKLISVRPHTRFVDFPAHSHNYVEIIYMCGGETTHIINGKNPVVLKKGELLMLNQHATHAISKAGKEDIAINFLVLPEFFDYALTLIGSDNTLGQFLVGSLQKGISDISYLHFKVGDIVQIQNIVENIILTVYEKQPNHRRLNQVSMGLLFLQLLNQTQHLQTEQRSKGSHALVLDALREIEENYRAARLSELGAKYGVSVAYYSKIIKETTKRTFKALLQEKRLAKAAELLSSTSLSVGEVIAAVGYDNQSYFYRIFRDKFGVAPRQLESMGDTLPLEKT